MADEYATSAALETSLHTQGEVVDLDKDLLAEYQLASCNSAGLTACVEPTHQQESWYRHDGILRLQAQLSIAVEGNSQ